MTGPLDDRAAARLLAMAAEEETPAPPRVPERYEIVRAVGRGGMGVVYEAIDRQLGRSCAVKTLASGAGADDELRRRFAREALSAARLQHPHIAAVYDATPDYISMQLIAGGPIDRLPRADGRLIVELVRDAARALHHAHEQGIVHRDVKPSNLLVEDRRVFVVDFGLAKAIDAQASVSLAGAVVGTPAFMPPEQALGRVGQIDARSDVYGLGATLHHCLAGAPPFQAPDLPTLLRRVVEDDPPALGIDRDLDLVVRKCLEKDPERRYASAAQLADDLDRWLCDEPVRARSPSLWYRLQKRLRRQRLLWRAAAVAALGAGVVTALVLAPIVLRESAARSAASEAVELADHAAAVLQDAAVFVRFGDHASAHRALDGGIDRAREFLGRHEVARARYLLGRLLRARGMTDEALAELQRAIDAVPDLVDARFERGLLLASLLEPTPPQRQTAIGDLTIGVRERSVLTNVDRLFGRGELARLEGRHEEAIELLEEVLEYDTTHVAARLSLSRAALALGRDDLARYYSASAIDLHLGYGPVYLARERQSLPVKIFGLEGAMIDFAPELRDAPDNALAIAHRGLVRLRRALRLHDEGRLGEALADVSAAIEDHEYVLVLHEGLTGALNNLAVCRLVADRLLAESGDSAGAAAARTAAAAELARAAELAPQLPEVHCNRGLCELRAVTLQRALGRSPATSAEAAAEAFARALELAPADWPHERLCRDGLKALASLRGG